MFNCSDLIKKLEQKNNKTIEQKNIRTIEQRNIRTITLKFCRIPNSELRTPNIVIGILEYWDVGGQSRQRLLLWTVIE
jgi:hypothetical protein